MAEQEILALGPDPQVVGTISNAFTSPSWHKLKNADDAKAAIRLAQADPVLRQECRLANAAVQRMASPMGPDAVYVALQPCLILFGAPTFGDRDGLTVAWIRVYQDALKHLPKEALEHAVSDWIANGKPFFPKPAELIARAKAKVEEVALISWRCRCVAEAPAARPEVIAPEEREAVAEGLRALAAEMAAKAREKEAAMRPPQRPTMDKHAMAEVLRRNAELFERQKDGAAPTNAELEAMQAG